MCGPVWSSDLGKLPMVVLCKKLHFLLLHCQISTINYMYSIGLFHNRDVLSIVVKAVKQRNEHTDSQAGGIMRCHCMYCILHYKYLFLLSFNKLNRFYTPQWLIKCSTIRKVTTSSCSVNINTNHSQGLPQLMIHNLVHQRAVYTVIVIPDRKYWICQNKIILFTISLWHISIL